MIEIEPKQGEKNSTDNQKEDCDKECDELWCDQALEVAPETAKNSLGLFGNLVSVQKIDDDGKIQNE